MVVPALAQCPCCSRGIKWFYGTGRFAKHNNPRDGMPCTGNRIQGTVKGAAFGSSRAFVRGLTDPTVPYAAVASATEVTENS